MPAGVPEGVPRDTLDVLKDLGKACTEPPPPPLPNPAPPPPAPPHGPKGLLAPWGPLPIIISSRCLLLLLLVLLLPLMLLMLPRPDNSTCCCCCCSHWSWCCSCCWCCSICCCCCCCCFSLSWATSGAVYCCLPVGSCGGRDALWLPLLFPEEGAPRGDREEEEDDEEEDSSKRKRPEGEAPPEKEWLPAGRGDVSGEMQATSAASHTHRGQCKLSDRKNRVEIQVLSVGRRTHRGEKFGSKHGQSPRP